MTIGADNVSNGSGSAQDRFSGGVSAYRQTRRESADNGETELMPRATSSGLPARSPGRSHSIDPTGALDRAAKLPSLGLHGLTEPVFPTSGGTWSSLGTHPVSAPVTDLGSQPMADHPLLRGLLLELPARGSLPNSDWLDRWFEAARSILELLYVQEAHRG
jgi:hypothetical protein